MKIIRKLVTKFSLEAFQLMIKILLDAGYEELADEITENTTIKK